MPVINPCLKCGACCSFYRVSFYWTEADPALSGTVPPEFSEPLPPYHACMRGTNQPHPRCAALRGRLGDQVSCSIYKMRSSTCREFGFHFKNNEVTITADDLQRCNHAREACGLPPLHLENIIRSLRTQPRHHLAHPFHHSPVLHK